MSQPNNSIDNVSLYIVATKSPIIKSSLIKIGISSSPQKRINGIKTGCPHVISLVWVSSCVSRSEALDIESDIHKLLKKWRVSGEWFGSLPKRISDVFNSYIDKSQEDCCSGMSMALALKESLNYIRPVSGKKKNGPHPASWDELCHRYSKLSSSDVLKAVSYSIDHGIPIHECFATNKPR